jgi:acetolactate decarboxylase
MLSAGCTKKIDTSVDRDTLYQVSTINSLLSGNYDGFVTIEELKKHGDIGVGTFDMLDGEMIVLNGEVYQINSEGKVIKVNDEVTTPFAEVTKFEEDSSQNLTSIDSIDTLQKQLDNLIINRELFYAFRIDTEFDYIKTRSVPKQVKPYPILSEVTKNQSIFEYHDVKGTVVVVWCPEYVGGVNVSGYHMHFISDDRTMGGHLLDLRFQRGDVLVDEMKGFEMHLSNESTKGSLMDIEDEINKVER